jgi:hypothetical protein
MSNRDTNGRVIRCDFCGDVIRGNPDAAARVVYGTCPRCFEEFVGPTESGIDSAAASEIDFQMPVDLEVCVG